MPYEISTWTRRFVRAAGMLASLACLVVLGACAGGPTQPFTPAASANAAPDVSASVDVDARIRIQPGQTTASISWGRRSQPEFVVVFETVVSADGTILFDAAQIDVGTVVVIGPSGTATIAVDRKGNAKVALADADCDRDQDLIFHVAKVDVFASADVGRTFTLTVEALLRDGRTVRGYGELRLDP